MGTDNLKKFVGLNRQDFEVHQDAPDDWNAIESRLDAVDKASQKGRNVSVPLRYLVRAAAVISIVFGTVVYAAWVQWEQQHQAVMMTSELAEAEYYYNNLIAVKVAEISRIDRSAEAIIFQDMEMLDEAFKSLKADLQDNADNEEVVEAMIANYQIKLEILEQILSQLKKDEAS